MMKKNIANKIYLGLFIILCFGLTFTMCLHTFLNLRTADLEQQKLDKQQAIDNAPNIITVMPDQKFVTVHIGDNEDEFRVETRTRLDDEVGEKFSYIISNKDGQILKMMTVEERN